MADPREQGAGRLERQQRPDDTSVGRCKLQTLKEWQADGRAKKRLGWLRTKYSTPRGLRLSSTLKDDEAMCAPVVVDMYAALRICQTAGTWTRKPVDDSTSEGQQLLLDCTVSTKLQITSSSSVLAPVMSVAYWVKVLPLTRRQREQIVY